jgi:hypothetical protein
MMDQKLLDWVHDDSADDDMRIAAHQAADQAIKECVAPGSIHDLGFFVLLADLITLNSIVLLPLEVKKEMEKVLMAQKF